MSIDRDTKRFYDLTAVRTAEEWYPNDILLPTIREFLTFLPCNPRILDLGCGPGHESLRLFTEGASVLGLDFSEECIRVARERCPQCEFEREDFRELDSRFGKFHGVFAAGSLIHVSPPELPNVLNRVAEALGKPGYLLAIVLAGQGIHESWPVVENKKIRRVIYRHRARDLTPSGAGLRLCGELCLDDELISYGWRAHLLSRE